MELEIERIKQYERTKHEQTHKEHDRTHGKCQLIENVKKQKFH